MYAYIDCIDYVLFYNTWVIMYTVSMTLKLLYM